MDYKTMRKAILRADAAQLPKIAELVNKLSENQRKQYELIRELQNKMRPRSQEIWRLKQALKARGY